MYDPSLLISLCTQFALACNLTSFYYMITMGDGMPGWFFPQSMLIYAPLLYLINRLFLRRDRTMLSLGLLNVTLCGGMLLAYFLLEPWHGIAYVAFTVIFLAWLTISGCCSALNGPTLRSVLVTLDAALILLVAFVGYSSATKLDTVWSIPALAGLCACIIASATQRSAQPLGLKGWLAVGGAFGVLFLLLTILIGAATPAGHGLVAVWNLICGGINTVKSLVLRFVLFLLSLLPDAESDEMGWTELESYVQQGEELPVEEANPVLSVIFLVIAAVGAVFLLIWLIRQLRFIRLRRIGGDAVSSAPKRERTPLLQGIVRLVQSWISAIRFRIRLWRGRNTAAGLYFLLVHRSRRVPWYKRTGETPREFLLRLAATAGEDDELVSALKNLAKETDAAFYSGRSVQGKLPYAPLIRHRIGAAARTHLIRQQLQQLNFKQAKTPTAN